MNTAAHTLMAVGLAAMVVVGTAGCKGKSKTASRCENVADRMSALTMKTQLQAARKRGLSKDHIARLKEELDKSLDTERAASVKQCRKLVKREPAKASRWIDCILAANTQLAMGKCARAIARP